jgi:hypothetical protein
MTIGLAVLVLAALWWAWAEWLHPLWERLLPYID